MKKIWLIALMMLVGFVVFAGGSSDVTQNQTQQIAQNTAATAFQQIPIPQLSYFTERKTIAEWYKRWDKPSVTTYVYLVSFGKILGYYVCNGKPASTRSVLNPEYVQEGYGSYYAIEKQQQDLDGTYGDNNPGIRFFTAEGIAVEWGGDGACYIYTDAPIALNVPKLFVSK